MIVWVYIELGLSKSTCFFEKAPCALAPEKRLNYFLVSFQDRMGCPDNDGDGWSAEKSEWYNAQYERLVDAVNQAFDHWYSQEGITSSDVARSVQQATLSGRIFGRQMAEWYNVSLRCSMGAHDTEEHHNFPDLGGL